jgi:hypothetical protein
MMPLLRHYAIIIKMPLITTLIDDAEDADAISADDDDAD